MTGKSTRETISEPLAHILVNQEWFMLLCILHKLVIGFAVVGVINGIFIQEGIGASTSLLCSVLSCVVLPAVLPFSSGSKVKETFKVASSDNQIMMRRFASKQRH